MIIRIYARASVPVRKYQEIYNKKYIQYEQDLPKGADPLPRLKIQKNCFLSVRKAT